MPAVSNPNHHFDSSREVGVDIISSLPDTILHNILSYIPTKFAIRTSVLSKRWERVWQETPSFSITCYTRDHADLIYKTLSSYSNLNITSLDVTIGYNFYKVSIDRWIELAISRNAEYLSLILGSYCIIPDLFYVNSSVKQLSLTFGNLNPTCTVSWTSLRHLSLDSCTLRGESIANILSGCPMLKSLILKQTGVVHRLDLSKSVNLTRFDIIYERGWFLEPEEIVAPHIRYLSMKNILKHDILVGLFSLTQAKFNLDYCKYRAMDGDFLQRSVLKMLEKLQRVDKLTIGVVVLQVLSIAELRGLPFPLLKIKSLTLETMLVRSVFPGIIRLLQNSPGLKKITVYRTECSVIPNKKLNKYLVTGNVNSDRRWYNFFPTVEETRSSFNSGHVDLFMELVMCKAKTLDTPENRNLFSMVPCRKDGLGKATFNRFEINI